MNRDATFRVVGVFSLCFGIVLLALCWWSYTITHQAFESIRTFSSLLEQQRIQAVRAVDDAMGLITGVPGLALSIPGVTATPPPATTASTPATAGRSILGDLQSIIGLTPPSPGQSVVPPLISDLAPSAFTRSLGEIESKMRESRGVWERIGAGPLAPDLLNRLELVVSLLLSCLAILSLAMIALGIWLVAAPPSRRVA
ncbi:MAG: hypothetical protein ACKVVP_10790 [Chloroflexota bacterium]